MSIILSRFVTACLDYALAAWQTTTMDRLHLNRRTHVMRVLLESGSFHARSAISGVAERRSLPTGSAPGRMIYAEADII